MRNTAIMIGFAAVSTACGAPSADVRADRGTGDPGPSDVTPPAGGDTTGAPGDTGPVAVVLPEGVEGWPLPSCADPGARAERAFDLTRLDVEADPRSYIHGAGLAVGDLDDDGQDEILSVAKRSLVLFDLQPDGTWAATDLGVRPSTPRGAFYGASLVDIDLDGDLDAFITSLRAHNILLVNDGAAGFSHGNATYRIQGPIYHFSASSAWGDMDGDGDLDLVVAGFGDIDIERAQLGLLPALVSPMLVYERQEDGVFVHVEGLFDRHTNNQPVFNALWHDLDGDGDLDMYLANDQGETRFPCHPVFQEDGRFVRPASHTLEAAITGMGLGADDLNEDGVVDLLLPGVSSYGVLASQAGEWFEASRVSGLNPAGGVRTTVPWGADMVDIDNDGDLDVWGVFGSARYSFSDVEDTGVIDRDAKPEENDAVFVQVAPMRFEERAVELGVDVPDDNRGVAVGDLDGDGWRDVVVASITGTVYVWRARCGEAGAMVIGLSQAGGNPSAIGARVQVRMGDRQITRWIRAGGNGFASGGPPTVHVGTGDHLVADEVRVQWPDGGVSVWRDLPTRHRLVLHRP